MACRHRGFTRLPDNRGYVTAVTIVLMLSQIDGRNAISNVRSVAAQPYAFMVHSYR